ncbi:MAG: PDZ domain-containing protein [Pyrinomonadaceae bacterium]|nr:PDZ domain-containing protein [Pyrinomonadaceae bacterium]
MTYRGKILVAVLSAAITFYAFFGIVLGWFSAGAQQPINDPGAQMRIFESVLQHIQNDYVDEPDLQKVRAGALRGLAYGLDPYSSYLTADQVKAFQNRSGNGKVGIGATFSQFRSYLYVLSVVANSPADKAGLKAGDIIEYIDTRATRDISLYDARQLILGAPGSALKLRVLRTNAKPATLTVKRGSFEIPAAKVEIKKGGVGVIKVYSLDKGQAEKIRAQVQDLKAKGIGKIILDLRNVAIGDIDEGVAVANAFIKDGAIAQVIGRENNSKETFNAEPAKHIFDGEVVAIIDLGTAGAGEIIAAAILENKRGEVVGERSFGAGTKQQLFTLRGGDGLLLTVAKWASGSGKSFLGDKRSESGVKPSVEVKRPETPEPIEVAELVEKKEEDPDQPTPADRPSEAQKRQKPAREDLQMKKALELMRGKAKAAGAE